MDCPKCGKAMETGYLLGSRRDLPIYWLPKEHKDDFFIYTDKAVYKRDGLVWDKGFLEQPLLETYICRDCGIGMFTFNTDD